MGQERKGTFCRRQGSSHRTMPPPLPFPFSLYIKTMCLQYATYRRECRPLNPSASPHGHKIWSRLPGEKLDVRASRQDFQAWIMAALHFPIRSLKVLTRNFCAGRAGGARRAGTVFLPQRGGWHQLSAGLLKHHDHSHVMMTIRRFHLESRRVIDITSYLC